MILPTQENAKNGASIEQIRGVVAMRCEPPAPTRTGPPAPDPAWAEALRLVDSRAAAGVNPDLDRAALAIIRAKLAEIEGRTARGLELVGVESIFAQLAPTPWLCEGLQLTPGRPAMLAGLGSSGKTIAAQSLALSIAADKRIWGWFRPSRGAQRVIHVDHEQGKHATYKRYQRLALGAGIDPQELLEPLDAAKPGRSRLAVTCFPDVHLTSAAALDVYSRECDGAALCILDALRGATPGVDENDSRIRQYIDMLGQVSDKTGCAFLLIHHARKAPVQGEREPDLSAILRGSAAIFDACGTVYILAGERGEKGSVAPKRVSLAKPPAEADGPPPDPFYLELIDVEIDGRPRAGLAIAYKTVEQVHPPKAEQREEGLERNVDALVAYVLDQTAHGRAVASMSAPASVLKIRKAACLDAFKTAVSRGLIVKRGSRLALEYWAAGHAPNSPAAPPANDA